MWKILSLAFLVSCLFPYTQILPLESYTQPYPLLFGLIVFAMRAGSILRRIPRLDTIALVGLAAVGVGAFLIYCLPPDAEDFKYLLVYTAPLMLTVAAVATFRQFPRSSLRIIEISAAIWLAVGLVQTLYDPNFASSLVGQWQDAATVVVESGRGVLGLAPEPTHYGFHLVIMGALLATLGGSRILAWSCVAGAVLLARSTSAALALFLGAGLFVLRMPLKYKIPILLSLLLSPLAVYALVERFDPASSRLLYLASAFLDEPAAILQIDYSVNVRMGGLIATFRDSLDNYLLPHGLSHADWLEHSLEIVRRFSWLFDLSDNGPPTGFGMVIYQLGFIGVLLLMRPIWRIVSLPVPNFDRIILLAVVWVFVFQYYISTPGYSLVYAATIAAAAARRKRLVMSRTPTQLDARTALSGVGG